MGMGSNGTGGKATAVLCAVVAGSSYGIGGAVSQIVKAQGFEIVDIVVAQFLVATILLGVLSLIWFRARMSVKEILQLCLVGAASTISSLSYYFAIDLLTVGQAVAIQFQYVWIAVLIQSVVERIRPNAWVVAASALIIFGTVFGSGLADEVLAGGVSMDPIGVAAAVLCAVFYALFIYLNGRVAVQHPPVTRSFFMVLGGLAVVSAINPSFYAGGCDVVALAPGALAMGLIMSVVPVICLASASKRLPGGIVAILTSTELPMAVVAGCLLLGESATPLTIFGIVVICASIVLSELGPSWRAKTAAADGDSLPGAAG